MDYIKRRKKIRKPEPYGIEDRFFKFLNFDEKIEVDFNAQMVLLKTIFRDPRKVEYLSMR